MKTVECAPAYRTEVSHARAWITGVVIDVTKVNARSYNLVKTVEPALIPLLVRRNALVTETGPGVLARLRLTRARRAIATHAEVMVVVKKSRTEALHVAAQIIGVALDVTKVNARNCNPAKTAERAPTHRTEALCAVAQIIGVALDVTKVNARNCNPVKTAERAPTRRTEALCAYACLNGVETFAS